MKYVKEFFDDFAVNPAKSKIIIKWIIYISFFSIIGAFTLGTLKSDRFNKISNIEKQVMINQQYIKEVDSKITVLNTKVDSGFKFVKKDMTTNLLTISTLMSSYQGFVQGQMEILIDYGKENKGLLKSALLLRQEDNQRLINQTVKSAINELNSIPDNLSSTSYINVKKTGEDDNYDVTIHTMKNASVSQMDSISANFKIVSVELQDNGKYKIVYKIK
jgi:hypothetical protein